MLIVRYTTSLQKVNLATAEPGTLYVLPNGEVYEFHLDGQLGGIGSFFKKIAQVALPLAGAIAAPFTGGLSAAAAATLTSALSAGGQVAAGLLGGVGGGSSSGQAKGLAAINAYGQKVISTLDQLLQTGQVTAELLQAAEQLVNSLGDSTYVYQAKKGNDAAALANFKSQAAQKLEQVRALAVQTAQAMQQQQQQQAQQNGNNSAGQSQNQTGILGGIDSSTILLVGGVFAVIYLLKK